MIIKITPKEKKELENILELFNSNVPEMVNLAVNLLEKYKRFYKYYSFLYYKEKPSEKYNWVINEYYVDGVNGNAKEFYDCVYIEYYFSKPCDVYSYSSTVRRLLLEATIQERDIFYDY